MFKELLTCDASHLLQDLDTYLGEKEWFIGNSVSMFYILKKYKHIHIWINQKLYKNVLKKVLLIGRESVREQGQKLNFSE